MARKPMSPELKRTLRTLQDCEQIEEDVRADFAKEFGPTTGTDPELERFGVPGMHVDDIDLRASEHYQREDYALEVTRQVIAAFFPGPKRRQCVACAGSGLSVADGEPEACRVCNGRKVVA